MKKQTGSVITLVVASVLLGVCQLAWSTSIPFSTDFESDTIGNEPAGFAQLGNTADPDISLDVVAAESSFTGGSQALEWLDNSAIANPNIFAFDLATGTTDDLVMRFDFQRVVNTGNDGQLRFQVYDDTGTRLIRLDLNNGGRILNNGGGDTLEFTGTGNWHTLEITTDLANNTYDLVLERDDRGSADTFLGLPFNNAGSNIAEMRFNDFAGSGKLGHYYLDNISATVIPEPGTISMMVLAGGLLAARRVMRKSK